MKPATQVLIERYQKHLYAIAFNNLTYAETNKMQKMSFRIHLFSITHIKKSLIQKNISVPG